ALSKQACTSLIKHFENSGAAVPGRVGGGVMPELKHSRDIQITGKAEWCDAENALNAAMFKGLLHYIRKYPHTLIAPLMLQLPEASTNKPRRLSADDFKPMPDKQLGDIVRNVLRPGAINLQRYTANQGGYPYWHCELYPKDASCDTLHRAVLWTIYLNDDFSEGETEFLYQHKKIQPKTGSLLIAPTAFTHTHRGNTPINGDKYIATSWVLYQRAEVLYPAN
ncbi:MAG: 2OG-Fe(II) oxygenase, partial [Arenimonas sp.]